MIIRGHDLQEHDVDQFEELKKIYGISGYQLAIKKSFAIDDQRLTDEAIAKINPEVFENTKILGAYFNPVHPDKTEIEDGIANFIFNMKLAQSYNIKYVASETGSVLGSPWDYHPDNHLPSSVELTTAAFKTIADSTKDINVQIAIEPAFHHVIKDVDSLLDMNEQIGDERLVYVLDVYNLLNSRPYIDYKQILNEFLTKAGNKTKIVHLKDFIIENEQVKQVKIGEGIVDFEFLINEIKKYSTDALFVLEGTLEEDLKDAMNLLEKYMVD